MKPISTIWLVIAGCATGGLLGKGVLAVYDAHQSSRLAARPYVEIDNSHGLILRQSYGDRRLPSAFCKAHSVSAAPREKDPRIIGLELKDCADAIERARQFTSRKLFVAAEHVRAFQTPR